MRSWKKRLNRGFTLVELMIVVAIIGVLAALAIYGVNRYLKSSKTSEAKNTIGAISRGAQAAFEREQAAPELLAAGAAGTTLNHDICGSSDLSIAAVPVGTKTQPDPATFETFNATGNTQNVGWLCLKFSVTNPTYYQYGYDSVRLGALPAGEAVGSADGATPGALTAILAMPAAGFYAWAAGDLDADTVQSAFGIIGEVDPGSRTMKVGTQVIISEELE